MEINKEVLFKKEQELEAQFEKLKADLNAVMGARQVIAHLKSLLEKVEEKTGEALTEAGEKLEGK